MKSKSSAMVFGAASQGKNARLAQILSEGGCADEANEVGFTALMAASEDGNESAVKLLIAHGANVNSSASKSISSARGVTALILAVRFGHAHIVRILVKAGANVNAETTWGESPLYEAVVRHDTKTVRFLLTHGARPTLPPTFLVVKEGDRNTLRGLLSAGADPNWRDPKSKETLLGEAVRLTRYPVLVNVLLKAGAETNQLSGRRFPLNLTAWQGDLETCKTLLLHGADVNKQDLFRRTPLMDAAFKGQEQVVKFLLRRGADRNLRDKDGNRAYDLAKAADHSKVVQLLL